MKPYTELTNFRPDELPVYKKAVDTSPQPGFRIELKPADFGGRVKPIETDYSLHFDGDGDAGPFWRNFEKIQAEAKK